MISKFGFLIPDLRIGRARRSLKLRLAIHGSATHQEDTKKNCITVRVMGLGKAVKIALDDVFERIDVAYQTAHSDCRLSVSIRMVDTSAVGPMTYDQLERHRGFERAGNLVGIFADTRGTSAHCSNCLAQALLSRAP